MSEAYPVEKLNYAAITLLEHMGILEPNESQIGSMEEVLSVAGFNANIKINEMLSNKQQDCLYWAAHGYCVKQTAQRMCVAPSTIASHRQAILVKLDCRSIAHAVYKGMHLNYFIPERLVRQIVNGVNGG